MMKMKMCLLLTSLYCISCSPENLTLVEPAESEPTESVTNELDVFVANFEREARARGISIDVSALGIELSLVDIEEDNVAGVCYYHSHQPGRIEIDLPLYNRMSLLQREYVAFHELGHCVLARGHTEAKFSNGLCRSIMASGTGDCRQQYTSATRDYYLDELFDGNF